MIWSIFRQGEIDLFALKENSHCPTFFVKEQDALAYESSPSTLHAFLEEAALLEKMHKGTERAICGPMHLFFFKQKNRQWKVSLDAKRSTSA